MKNFAKLLTTALMDWLPGSGIAGCGGSEGRQGRSRSKTNRNLHQFR